MSGPSSSTEKTHSHGPGSTSSTACNSVRGAPSAVARTVTVAVSPLAEGNWPGTDVSWPGSSVTLQGLGQPGASTEKATARPEVLRTLNASGGGSVVGAGPAPGGSGSGLGSGSGNPPHPLATSPARIIQPQRPSEDVLIPATYHPVPAPFAPADPASSCPAMDLHEAEAAVAKGLARCKATMAALKSSAPIDDLPSEAARVMTELEHAQTSLRDLHTKALRFAEDAYSLRKEAEVLWAFLADVACLPNPESRAAAAREMLARR